MNLAYTTVLLSDEPYHCCFTT